MASIHKKDKVVVLVGKDRGKQGEVVQVLPDAQRVIVSKINFVKRHTRPTQTQPGGIREKEASIHISNVMPFCSKCAKPVRTRRTALENGEKQRVCAKCGNSL